MSNSKTMSFLSSGVFWGAIIILFGLSIVLKEIFHVQIPFVRILLGLILVWWGVRMIAGGFNRSWSTHSAVFRESKMSYDGSNREYNIVFGSGMIDLFKMENKGNQKIEVNVVFGRGTLVLNDSIPAKVAMNAVFGSAQAPDKSANGFGETSYTTSAYREGEPHLFIESNVVFGRLAIESKRW